MNLKDDKLYFFTIEIPCRNLPMECTFMRFLRNDFNRKVILIKTNEPVQPDNISDYVLEPRYQGSSFLEDDLVFVYVLSGVEYEDRDEIELSEITSSDILNWGGLTNSLVDARKWQI